MSRGKVLTHEYLLEILDFNQETGKFYWKIYRKNNVRVGAEAGSIIKSPRKRTPHRMLEIDNKSYLLHRLAWFYVNKKWPEGQIDHIDKNGLNNSMKNLREATNEQNQANTDGKSKLGFLKGTHRQTNGRYQARIQANGKQKALGTFDTMQEAHEAYCKAATELFGDFASF